MPMASNLQTSFLGGEWSRDAQGASDDKRYKISLALCRNMMPLEEGALTRRPGTQVRSSTREGNPARIVNFDFTATSPYVLEFTDGHLRFGAGLDLVTDNTAYVVSDITTANPAVVTVTEMAWVTGDVVKFNFLDETTRLALAALTNREILIQVLSTTTFAIFDALTGGPITGIT